MPAAAKGNGGPASQPEDLALLIDNLKIPLDAKRSVAEDSHLSTRHEFLR